MQVNIFGKPGDGKSYSTVLFIGLFALAQKRRWLTNINGVNPAEINKYLNELVTRSARPDAVEKPTLLQRLFGAASSLVSGLDSTERRLLSVMQKHETDTGSFDFTPYIITVDEETVKDPEFWYSPEWAESSIMQPGDCVTIDEARRYFGSGMKVPERTIMCILKHRHYVSTVTNLSIDLYFIAQQPNHLQREVAGNAQFTYVARRMLAAGKLKENRFRLDFYEGAVGATEMKRREFYDGQEEKLNPRIFKLYKSFEGEKGFESKQNIVTIWSVKFWGLSLFKFWVPVAGLLFLAGLAWVVNFFITGGLPHGKSAKPIPAVTAPAPAVGVSAPSSGADPARPSSPSPAPVVAVKPVQIDDVDSVYRLVGFYSIDQRTMAVITDSNGRIRYISDFKFTNTGAFPEISWKGHTVTYWSGTPSTLPQLSEKKNAAATPLFGR